MAALGEEIRRVLLDRGERGPAFGVRDRGRDGAAQVLQLGKGLRVGPAAGAVYDQLAHRPAAGERTVEIGIAHGPNLRRALLHDYRDALVFQGFYQFFGVAPVPRLDEELHLGAAHRGGAEDALVLHLDDVAAGLGDHPRHLGEAAGDVGHGDAQAREAAVAHEAAHQHRGEDAAVDVAPRDRQADAPAGKLDWTPAEAAALPAALAIGLEIASSPLATINALGPRVVVSATKGIEPETLTRMSQVTFEEGMAADSDLSFAVLSGPSFAVELVQGMATAAVIAAEDQELAASLREELSSETLRLYSSADVVGVELGGTAKNVIAIAAGTLTGLGMGHNTLAALITRGLHEITRLGIAYGGQPRTFAGLAGLGDLVLTCTGGLSRNRATGIALAHGRTLDEIEAETNMVAEGVKNSVAVSRLARQRGVDMPIVEQMVEILYHGKPPAQALRDLMTRELKAEAEL